jgi:hypothetical protein
MCKKASLALMVPSDESIIISKEVTSMPCFNQGVFRRQARFLRHQYLQDGVLPFGNVRSEEAVMRSLAAIKT